MAAGSREIYALDLNDIFAFPDGENVPIKPPNTAAGESWVMLLEIKDFPPSRQRYVAVDITGKWFTVMINTSNPSLDTADYESGYTLCILNAEPLFGPNYINYEVNDISTVELLPVPLAKLWELNDRLRTRSDAGDLLKCLSCGNAGELCCSECQRADWPEHKLECKALGVLRRYNETDWG